MYTPNALAGWATAQVSYNAWGVRPKAGKHEIKNCPSKGAPQPTRRDQHVTSSREPTPRARATQVTPKQTPNREMQDKPFLHRLAHQNLKKHFHPTRNHVLRLVTARAIAGRAQDAKAHTTQYKKQTGTHT